MNVSMKVLLYAIKYGKDVDCDLFDYEVARDLCRIYKVDFRRESNDLLHFLAFVKDNYGGHLSYVLERAIEDFERSSINENDFNGLLKHLTHLRKDQIVSDFLLYCKSLSDIAPNVFVDKAKKFISDIERFDFKEEDLKISDIVSEVVDSVISKMENPGIPGISTGFSNLDEAIGGYIPGTLFYIGGRPGHGKSAFMINSALKVAKEVPVLIVSREMTSEQIAMRMISCVSGVPLAKMHFGVGLTKSDIDKIKEASIYISSLPIYIDDSFGSSSYKVISNIRRYVKDKNVRVVFIDYIQLLADRSSDSTHVLGRISRDLKLLAVDEKISVIVLSQLNRDVEKREDKRPRPSDLRQSGNLEEDGDYVAFVYREEVYNPKKSNGKMELILTKNRHLGVLGTLYFKFEGEIYRIEEMSDG